MKQYFHTEKVMDGIYHINDPLMILLWFLGVGGVIVNRLLSGEQNQSTKSKFKK